MEFEKLFRGFTIFAVVILLLSTFFSATYVVAKRGNANISTQYIMENNEK